MLQLRNVRRKRRNPPAPTVPRPIVVRETSEPLQIDLIYVDHIQQPWRRNVAKGPPSFAGKDLDMYTFNFPDNVDASNFSFSIDPKSKPIRCYMFSNTDLDHYQTLVYNANTFHGLLEADEKDRMVFGKYLAVGSKSLEIPACYWAPHDLTHKFSFEMDVFDSDGSQIILKSPQFSSATTVDHHIA
jgi:hypothetical protein